MKRLGAILVPMLVGFLLTVAVVSWRSGGWPWRKALESPAAAPLHVEARRPNLRVVQVDLNGASPATFAAAPAATRAASIPAAAPATESEPETYEPPPIPRIDAGNSPERLEAPARKFAHGSKAEED